MNALKVPYDQPLIASVTGVDQNGHAAPLPAAAVLAFAGVDGVAQAANPDGSFTITATQPGNLTVTATSGAFTTSEAVELDPLVATGIVLTITPAPAKTS